MHVEIDFNFNTADAFGDRVHHIPLVRTGNGPVTVPTAWPRNPVGTNSGSQGVLKPLAIGWLTFSGAAQSTDLNAAYYRVINIDHL